VVDRAWLLKKGFSRPRVDAFVRSGVLQAVARGLSALQQQGLSHYLALSDKNAIQLTAPPRCRIGCLR